MIKLISIVFYVSLLLSCGNTNSISKVEKINDDIMRLHDEAMSKSSYILKLKKITNNKLDSLSNLSLKDTFQHLSAELYRADRAMLDWMHQYNEPNMKSDTAEKYLQEQLVEIKKVHTLTFKSIQNAERILDEK